MPKFGVVPGLFAGLVLLSLPAVSSAGISLSIRIAPPALEVYQQPLCPTDGYLWTPGYWGYGNAGYYWIPGAWVAPPQAGFLWTPGYWSFSGGLYSFNAGYWGPTVGFYGGVNYGFGYGGSGFDGGRWQGGHFAYNTAVSRVNTTISHNTYNQAVASHGNDRTSFNGGPGGISARPGSAETATARQHNQPAANPVAQQRAATARPAAAPASANNRSAEPASRMAARPSPNTARPEARQAASPRAEQPGQVASARSSAPAPSRPAPQARPQARVAAPEHAAARPAEGKEERR